MHINRALELMEFGGAQKSKKNKKTTCASCCPDEKIKKASEVWHTSWCNIKTTGRSQADVDFVCNKLFDDVVKISQRNLTDIKKKLDYLRSLLKYDAEKCRCTVESRKAWKKLQELVENAGDDVEDDAESFVRSKVWRRWRDSVSSDPVDGSNMSEYYGILGSYLREVDDWRREESRRHQDKRAYVEAARDFASDAFEKYTSRSASNLVAVVSKDMPIQAKMRELSDIYQNCPCLFQEILAGMHTVDGLLAVRSSDLNEKFDPWSTKVNKKQRLYENTYSGPSAKNVKPVKVALGKGADMTTGFMVQDVDGNWVAQEYTPDEPAHSLRDTDAYMRFKELLDREV